MSFKQNVISHFTRDDEQSRGFTYLDAATELRLTHCFHCLSTARQKLSPIWGADSFCPTDFTQEEANQSLTHYSYLPSQSRRRQTANMEEQPHVAVGQAGKDTQENNAWREAQLHGPPSSVHDAFRRECRIISNVRKE